MRNAILIQSRLTELPCSARLILAAGALTFNYSPHKSFTKELVLSTQQLGPMTFRPLSIPAICRRLAKEYGPVVPPQQRPVLDQLISTILSQNTSNANSRPAFEELQRCFPDWEQARRAPSSRIAKAIRRAGLSNQKAPRIKKILEQIHEQRGELSLEFLHDWPPHEALDYLLSFHGVGRKTAACVLLFACQQPVLPVDTHIHRIGQRMRLIGEDVTADQSHDELAKLTPDHLVLDFHIQVIRHGRNVCHARNPKCLKCVLIDRCPEGAQQLSAMAGNTQRKRSASLQRRMRRS
jgi:endonuclease-3